MSGTRPPKQAQPWSGLLPHEEVRAKVWNQVTSAVEKFITSVETRRVTPELAVTDIRRSLEKFDFAAPVSPAEALEFVETGLTEFQTHTPHPRYFGLFNPAPTAMGVAADMLAAVADTGNRQLLNRAAELNGSAALHLRLHSRTLY